MVPLGPLLSKLNSPSPFSPSSCDHPPQPADGTLPNATQDADGLLCCKGAFLVHGVQKNSHVLFNKVASRGFFFPKSRIWHFALLNIVRLLFACFSHVLRSLWMAAAAQPSGVPSTPPSHMSSANLLEAHPVLSSRSLVKLLSSTGSSMHLWRVPLLTGLRRGYKPLLASLWVWHFTHLSLCLTVH